jgi:hypothetical protein
MRALPQIFSMNIREKEKRAGFGHTSISFKEMETLVEDVF